MTTIVTGVDSMEMTTQSVEQIFSKRMQERGLQKTRSNAGMVYKDVVTVKNNLLILTTSKGSKRV